MKEPIRWKDDPGAPEGSQDLLRSAKPTAPMPSSAYSALAAEVHAIPATVTTGTPFAASLGSLGLGAKAAAGIVALAAASGAVWTIRDARRPERPVRSAPAPVAEEQAPAPLPASPPLPAAPAPRQAEVTAPVGPEKPIKRKPRPARAKRVWPAQDLVAEAKLLETARRAVETAPQKALDTLKTHARRYPEGALAAEREVLAIEALGRVGRTTEQRRRAARFLNRFGNSPYADRVRRVAPR